MAQDGTSLNFIDTFLDYIEPILSESCTPPHQLTVPTDRLSAKLEFPTQDSMGFEVSVEADSHGLTLQFGMLAHSQIDAGLTEANHREVIENAMGLVRDLLSPAGRLREKWTGGTPYWAAIEFNIGDHWAIETSTRLIFFNYFGAHTERLFVNHQMSARDVART